MVLGLERPTWQAKLVQELQAIRVLLQLHSAAKVSNLHLHPVIDEDVVWLDVSVDNSAGMQVLQSPKYMPCSSLDKPRLAAITCKNHEREP